MDKYVDLGSLGAGLLWSVLAGAGLVAVFSFGLVGLSRHEGELVSGEHARRGASDTAGLVIAIVCFAVVLAGVGAGVWAMVDK